VPSIRSEPKASSSPKPQSTAVAAHVEALLEQLLQLLVHREALGLVHEGVADLVHDRGRYAGGLGLADGLLDAAGGGGDDAGRAGLRGVRLGERDLEAVLEVRLRLVVLLLGDVAAADERLGVEARTERFASMRFVISGCVIDGSSPSL
jgi:hypothetical protein